MIKKYIQFNENLDNFKRDEFISSIIDKEVNKTKKFGLEISDEDIELEKNIFIEIFENIWDKLEDYLSNKEYSDLRNIVNKYIQDNLKHLMRKYYDLSVEKPVKNMYNCHIDSCVSLLFLKINNKSYD